MSFAAYLSTLLFRDEVDEEGRPIWATTPAIACPSAPAATPAGKNGSEMAARATFPATKTA